MTTLRISKLERFYFLFLRTFDLKTGKIGMLKVELK